MPVCVRHVRYRVDQQIICTTPYLGMAAAICLLIGSFGLANAQSLDQQGLIMEW